MGTRILVKEQKISYDSRTCPNTLQIPNFPSKIKDEQTLSKTNLLLTSIWAHKA